MIPRIHYPMQKVHGVKGLEETAVEAGSVMTEEVVATTVTENVSEMIAVITERIPGIIVTGTVAEIASVMGIAEEIGAGALCDGIGADRPRGINHRSQFRCCPSWVHYQLRRPSHKNVRVYSGSVSNLLRTTVIRLDCCCF